MQQGYTISSGRNAMLKCGILRVYFDTFSSKNEYRVTFINNYNQSCSIDFRCCSFTGKERDEETGFGYFGARYMDHELMTMWLSVDPMADKYPSISPYAYCAWNPVKLVDPNGEEISTHTDHEGNVVAVFDDGDNGVYRHGPNRDGSAVTEYQITKRHEKYGTSARGEYMGQTKYWDEFMTHDGHSGEAQNPGGRILFGESWEETIANYNAMSNRTGLEATAIESHPGGVYDIKQNTRLAPDGVLTGKMLEGYYVSAESAGNYLAGLNGATGHWGLLNNHTVSKEFYMLLAGMLHSKANNTPIVPPYYGEIEYAGRWISYGFSVGEKIRNGK